MTNLGDQRPQPDGPDRSGRGDRSAAAWPSSAGRPAVALLTAAGRGALAVVGVFGDGLGLLDGLVAVTGGSIASRPSGSIIFGVWKPTGEQVVVVRHGPDRAEVHCHGGVAAPAAVVAALLAAGAVEWTWQEWPAACGQSLAEQEARAALPLAAGPKAARLLARQAAGAFDAEISRIASLLAAGDAAAADLAATRLLRVARVGLRLVDPWRVGFAGPVNAGKSSLFNALVGHARSIVSPLPGTTRDVVTARVVLDGWEVELADVAGLRVDPATAVERAGIERAAAWAASADLVLRVVPADADTADPSPATVNEILVVTKADLREEAGPAAAIRTSVVTGAGIAALASAIVARLVPEERDVPDLTAGAVPINPRQVAAVRALVSRPPASPRRCGPG